MQTLSQKTCLMVLFFWSNNTDKFQFFKKLAYLSATKWGRKWTQLVLHSFFLRLFPQLFPSNYWVQTAIQTFLSSLLSITKLFPHQLFFRLKQSCFCFCNTNVFLFSIIEQKKSWKKEKLTEKACIIHLTGTLCCLNTAVVSFCHCECVTSFILF